MKSRNGDELWQSIKSLSFDDPIADAIDSGERKTFTTPLGGIYEVTRYIYNEWTVKELDAFLMAWNATPYADKETLMGALPKPNDPKDTGAWEAWLANVNPGKRVLNLDCALHAIYKTALFAIGAKCYEVCKREDARIAFALDAEPYYNLTLTELEKTLPPPYVKILQDIGKNTEHTQAGVSFLVCDRKNRQKANRDRGKKNQAKGAGENASERQRANHNIGKALARVHERVKKQGQQILAACRWVCAHFATFTDAKKNAPTYLPLSKADGKPMKPQTLARYYRKRYGSKQGKK